MKPAKTSSIFGIQDRKFLAGMSQAHLKVLAQVAERQHLEPDAVIFREGERASGFYLIEKGMIALEARTEHQGIYLVQTLGTGDVMGWSWLFPPYRWHFDAHTLEPTDVVFMNGDRLREHCESDHDLGYELLMRMAHVMMDRLHATRRRLVELPSVPG